MMTTSNGGVTTPVARLLGILLTNDAGEELIVIFLYRRVNLRAQRVFSLAESVAPYSRALV
jgi:hypothetical protein